MSIRDLLPAEATGTFLGRLRVPGRRAPVPVLVTGNAVHDVSDIDPTVSGILETPDLPRRLDEVRTRPADWAVDDVSTPAAAAPGSADAPVLLAPIDLQVIIIIPSFVIRQIIVLLFTRSLSRFIPISLEWTSHPRYDCFNFAPLRI